MRLLACAVLIALSTTACQREAPAPASARMPRAQATTPARPIPFQARAVIRAARERTRNGEVYDPGYFAMSYPGGDVPVDRGVCTDVVVRAYRTIGLDLQVLVHEDMAKNFSHYPRLWGLRSTDRNIDHRRVPNLQVFFERQGASLPVTQDADDYLPGDLVTWRLPGNVPHIGIVSDRRYPDTNRALILHNIGYGSAEDDALFAFEITGHYRYYPSAQ